MSSKRAVRIFLRDGVHVRRRARFDGIALQAFLVSDTPTVVHTIPTQTMSGSGDNLRGRSNYMRQILFFTSTILCGGEERDDGSSDGLMISYLRA